MLLKGEMISQINDSYLNTNSTHHRHFPQLRQITSTSFYHRGIRICRKTYLFLHSIGIKRFTRIYEPTSRSTAFFLVCTATSAEFQSMRFAWRKTQIVARFITNYTEDNGIHLPGRIPGFKKTDIQLLPCHTTKKAVWRQYCLATQGCNPPARQAAYRTFLLIWQKLLPQIIIGKPMTDLCWYCQRHTSLILRAANQPEEEKTQVKLIETTIIEGSVYLLCFHADIERDRRTPATCYN